MNLRMFQFDTENYCYKLNEDFALFIDEVWNNGYDLDAEVTAYPQTSIKQKQIARRLLSAARRNGTIIVPDSCQSCGKLFSASNFNGHHNDYSKPLDVVWLCDKCHAQIHATGNYYTNVTESKTYYRKTLCKFSKLSWKQRKYTHKGTGSCNGC